MSNDITITTAEAQGFTHIEARCKCGTLCCMPFRLLIESRKAIGETKLANIAARMKCTACGQRGQSEWRPWRQYLDHIPIRYGHSQ